MVDGETEEAALGLDGLEGFGVSDLQVELPEHVQVVEAEFSLSGCSDQCVRARVTLYVAEPRDLCVYQSYRSLGLLLHVLDEGQLARHVSRDNLGLAHELHAVEVGVRCHRRHRGLLLSSKNF